MVKLILNVPINVGGKDKVKGDTIEVSKEIAKIYLVNKTATEAKTKK